MQTYHLMFLDEFGAVRRQIEMECRNDAHALEVIKSHDLGTVMELWKAGRLVARFQGEDDLRGI